MAPEKAYLKIIKPKSAGGAPGGGTEIGRVTFRYNPKEFSYKKTASWDRKPAKGATVLRALRSSREPTRSA